MKTIQAPIDFINDNWTIYNRLVLSGLNKYEIKRTMQISERQYHVLLSYKPKQPINTFDKQSNDTSNNYESELMDIAKQLSKKTDYCLLMKYRSMLAAISYNSPYKSV